MICSTYFALPKGAENLPKSVKGAGFLNVRSSLPSCSLRAKESKTPFTSVLASCYISRKPRGPVRKNTFSVAFATPTDKRGFVMPKFLGLVRLYAPVQWLRGMVGATRKGVRTATDVFLTTMLHLMRVRTQRVASLNPVGTKTMTAITQQASRAATSSPTTGTIPAAHITDVLAAFNAANMAASYIERGSFAAARRKLTQALASINQIKLEG